MLPSNCPTAQFFFPPSFLPFLTAAASAAGLVEKHDKKSQILTILTKNKRLTSSDKDIR